MWMELEEVQGVGQEWALIQGEPRSLPLLATGPGAEAEVKGVRLSCVSEEKLQAQRLPEAEEGSEQAETTTFSVVATLEPYSNE